MVKTYRWLLAGAALAGGVFFALLPSEPSPDKTSVTHTSPAQPNLSPTATPEDTAPVTPDQIAMLESPEFAAFERELDFQHRVRSFFDGASELTESERQEQAKALADEVVQYEEAGKVSAAEALTLRLALVRIGEPDAVAAEKATSELLADYKERAERGMDEWQNRPNPVFEHYKQREADIVDEVMAMDEIPGGQTQSEYLRERLLEARIEARKAGTAPSP